MRIRAVLGLSLLLVASACGSDREPAPGEELAGPETAESLDDGKADSTELRVRTGVTTLWVDKLALAEVATSGEPRITISGRTSRDLASVFAWVPDDAFGSAEVVSARTFQVVLDEGHEVNTLLSGLPIYVTIDTKTGTPSHYTARIRLATRLSKLQGSSALHPSTVIDPIYVRDEQNPLRYRGSVRTDSAATSLVVLTGEDADPLVTQVDPLRWQFDFTYDRLALAALPAGDTLKIAATLPSGSVEKQAAFEFRVLGVSMTTKDPYLAWPEAPCEPDVAQCVQQTAGDDLGACGSYREVSRCMHLDLPDPSRFAADFGSHLIGYYATYGADIAASGGASLEQAQQAIELGSVSELADPSEDPHGHDFAETIVFSHPDVVFPGSDRVWYGAYSRTSGELLEIYDFN